MDAEKMNVDDLAEACERETRRFHQNQPHTTDYCFELFRRAFAGEDMTALNRIYEIYIPQVTRWVRRHPAFERVSSNGVKDAEDFVSEALMSFHQAMQQPGKFNDFDYLAQVLQYLKRCVHSVVYEAARRQPPRVPRPIGTDREAGEVEPAADNLPDTELARRELIRQIWQHLETLFPDEHDRLLCRCLYIYQMKPREITAQHPDIWQTARDVSVAKQRIQRNIYSDPHLRRYARPGHSEDINPDTV